MKIFHTHILNRHDWRNGTAARRREIEIRFSLARVVRAKRRQARLTQQELAERIHAAQRTISRIERASPHVAMDISVRALIALDASDEEIGAAFNAGSHVPVCQLRERGKQKFLRPRTLHAGSVTMGESP